MNDALITIIIPTYREARNIPVLVERIVASMKKANLRYEIIIVDDDSNDGIVESVEDLRTKCNITLKVRKHERGLSSAVLAGFKAGNGDIFLVMDADLSHEPERIPELVNPILSGRSDFCVGSRFVKGGSSAHFSTYRKLNAWASKTLARPLTHVNDPLAGFFAVPRGVLNNHAELSPVGFKIGLEILVKCAPRRITEIPIEFQKRLHGESKLSLKEQTKYLIHLKRLYEYKFKTLSEFIKFSIVGCVGACVDLSFTYVAKSVWLLPFPIARAVGFIFALTANFLLNRRFTFGRARARNAAGQYVLFLAVCTLGFFVNWLTSVLLYCAVPFFNTHYLLASSVGILTGLTVNFTGSKFVAFK